MLSDSWLLRFILKAKAVHETSRKDTVLIRDCKQFLLTVSAGTRTMTALEETCCPPVQQWISCCLRLPALIDQGLSDPNATKILLRKNSKEFGNKTKDLAGYSALLWAYCYNPYGHLDFSCKYAISTSRTTTPVAIYRERTRKNPGMMSLMGQYHFSLSKHIQLSECWLLTWCFAQCRVKVQNLNLSGFGDSLLHFNLREQGNSQKWAMVAL